MGVKTKSAVMITLGPDTSLPLRDMAPSEDEKDGAPVEESVTEELCSLSSAILTRFVFFCGHVAFNELIHLDVTIFGELKRRHALMEEKQQKGKGQRNKSIVAVSASVAKAAKVCVHFY